MRNRSLHSILIVISCTLFLLCSFSFGADSPPEDKNTCPFSQNIGAMQDLKDEMTKFSFQIIDQGSQAKNTLCQNYMNTLNTARSAYTSIIKTRAMTGTLQTALGDPNAPSTVSQQELVTLNAQIQMSDAMQGLMSSSCQVDDQSAVSSTALQLMDSIAGTITLAGLMDPKLLIAGVSISAVSRLGVTLANWLLPKQETDRDRLNNDLKNSAFLDRLCIFRSLAYKVDEINPALTTLPIQRSNALNTLSITEAKLYDDEGMRCFMNLESAQLSYQKLGAELREVLNLTQSKPASEKCFNYKYALEDVGRTTNRYRSSHLFDLVWRIGCEDISLPDEVEPSPSPSASTSSAPISIPQYSSQRITDYCRHWRKLLDTFNQVDCFGTNTQAIDQFNLTAQYLFDHSAIVGEDAIRQMGSDQPDAYKNYLALKAQKDLLNTQLQKIDEAKNDRSNVIVQVEGMLTNLGNIILGTGLTEYAKWNQNEIKRNLDDSQEKLKSTQNGTGQDKCSAAQYATQRIRQIEPRSRSINRVCEYLGANGKPPKPAFNDKTRTFSSITDLEHSPLDQVCTQEYTGTPPELGELKKTTIQNLKECAQH